MTESCVSASCVNSASLLIPQLTSRRLRHSLSVNCVFRESGLGTWKAKTSYSARKGRNFIVTATKQTFLSFDDLLAKSEKPVLVDFYATWCGPCQYMVPILNEVSILLKDSVQVVKIDTEKYTSIADEYRIEALPTFIIFKDGKPIDRFEGAYTKDQLIERVQGTLNKKQ